MREGPEFIWRFMQWGIAFVSVATAIAVILFLLLRKWSEKQSRAYDEKAGAKRREEL